MGIERNLEELLEFHLKWLISHFLIPVLPKIKNIIVPSPDLIQKGLKRPIFLKSIKMIVILQDLASQANI
jgi:hypothetical protein